MINYNIKYRGEFEYDKFILNILQFNNDANLLSRKCFDEESELIKTKNSVDKIYNEYKQNNKSLDLYYRMLRLE